MMKKYLYGTATLFTALLIIYLSLTSRQVGVSVHNLDKVEHALAYGVQAFFLILTLRTWGFQGQGYLLTVLVCAVLGGALEIIQSRFGRSMDLYDFVADVAGALGGAAVIRRR